MMMMIISLPIILRLWVSVRVMGRKEAVWILKFESWVLSRIQKIRYDFLVIILVSHKVKNLTLGWLILSLVSLPLRMYGRTQMYSKPISTCQYGTRRMLRSFQHDRGLLVIMDMLVVLNDQKRVSALHT